MIFPKGEMRNEPPPNRDECKGIEGGCHMAARHRHRAGAIPQERPRSPVSRSLPDQCVSRRHRHRRSTASWTTSPSSVHPGRRAHQQPGREPLALAPPEGHEPDHQHRQCPPRTSSLSAAGAPTVGIGPPERRELDHRRWPPWARDHQLLGHQHHHWAPGRVDALPPQQEAWC